jgi:glutathione S-transferase
LAPHIVAYEAGIASQMEIIKVDLRSKTIPGGGDFFAVNPKGYVPALQLNDGTVLTEVAAIVQYLADLAPQTGLAPPNGTIARYQLQAMLNFLATEIHKAWSPLWDKETPTAQREAAHAKLDRRFNNLRPALEDKPWLLGEAYTVADSYLFTLANWGQWTGVDITRWPWIKAHYDRVKARPAVIAAIAAERASKQKPNPPN